ncbi:MAG: SDR family oxidoreductase [Alphaproteobacteria bacterium]|jgi:nucleoside-diphosphate-sugar epimerase|nr:SDR family oxidoreductase [Alphaproteobacteria bacterium]MBT5860312.1 SDR family oxidoreductase [Alphaproteobacteria bacterium]
MSHLFCFGLGYTGTALAKSLMADGWTVSGTCRTAEHQKTLADDGITAHLFDRDHPMSPDVLKGATHILNSVPPDSHGDPVLDAMAAFVAEAQATWVGYLSTTGVYGDRGGDWVDETAEMAPTAERSHRRVMAEGTWFVLWRETSLPVHIFRLAGIYGPGRSPLDQIRSGAARRINKPGHTFSRIHVDDIVAVLRASMAAPSPGSVYNVCDDEPAASSDVTAYGCELLGVEPPALVDFADAELSEMAQSFYRDNKRVINAKIKSDLGVTLKYPNYRAGLASLV